ncbi:hypothetical protein GCM10027040_08870 [Halomonas shantousis]
MKLFLIILFAMLVMLSPVLWLRPSRRESRLGTVRQEAKARGTEVRFENPPLANAPGGVVAYRWYYPQATPGAKFVAVRNAVASEQLETFTSGWRWRQAPLPPIDSRRRKAVAATLDDLPEDALLLESSSRSLTLWWGESLEPEAAGAMITQMQALMTLLAGSGRSATASRLSARRE